MFDPSNFSHIFLVTTIQGVKGSAQNGPGFGTNDEVEYVMDELFQLLYDYQRSQARLFLYEQILKTFGLCTKVYAILPVMDNLRSSLDNLDNDWSGCDDASFDGEQQFGSWHVLVRSPLDARRSRGSKVQDAEHSSVQATRHK